MFIIKSVRFLLTLFTMSLVVSLVSGAAAWPKSSTTMISDAWGRKISIPAKVNHVICSGPGCLRCLVYLQGLDLVVLPTRCCL